MTKTEFCRMIVNEFEQKEKMKPRDVDVLSSSTLAVAMEYLGLIISPEMREYASGRGGIMMFGNTGVDNTEENVLFKSLTARYILSLLPE